MGRQLPLVISERRIAIMYCFYFMNKVTREETCIYGYDLKKAMVKEDMSLNDYEYLGRDYVD